jgi:hypothetical protein
VLRNFIAGLLTFAVLYAPLCAPDQDDRQPLFKIERSKNANIIQYDAQIGPDGKLDQRKPVLVYWIRLAEDGQTRKLSWLQKTFVYGFKARFDRKTDSVILDMNSDLSPPIRVARINGSYQATVEIDGKTSRLVRVFLHSTGKGLSTRLEYMEMYSTDLETGEDLYQRFDP